MANEKKIETVKQLKEKLEKSKLTVFTDYRGLKTTNLNQLRDDLRESDAQYLVTKNTLLSRALKEAGKDNLVGNETLQGPTATLFAYSDEIIPIKSLLKIIRTTNLPVIKTGILSSQSLTKDQVELLGTLPGREVLLSKVLSGFSSPLYGIVNVLSANIRDLAYVLNAVKEVNLDGGKIKH